MEMTISKGKELTVYDPVKQQLEVIKAENARLVFDYEDPEQNKRARSYVYRLRQLKAEVEKQRKAEKEESLNYGRLVDQKAKEISVEIEEMIEVHAVPIAAIEQREKDRVAAIQARIAEMRDAAEFADHGDVTVEEIKARLETVQAVEIDDSFAEFLPDAAKTKDAVIRSLRGALALAEKDAAEAAEAARLIREAEAKAVAEREERIRKEAADKAAAEAEEKAKAERAAFERREIELRLEKERAEKEKLEAEQRADRAAKETEARIARETEEKAKRERAEAEARRKDEVRMETVKAEISAAIGSYKTRADLVDAMIAGSIPHVTVNV